MMPTIRLGDLATVRSGDKGNHANVGVVARSADAYQLLVAHLTGDLLLDALRPWGARRVERFELPRLGALNFLVYDVLQGGASAALRIDTQGKLLGTALEELPLLVPERPASGDSGQGDSGQGDSGQGDSKM